MQPVHDQQVPSERKAPEWLARGERSNVTAIRLIVWIALTMGRRVARAILVFISLYFMVFSHAAMRAASRAYLQQVLGRKPGWLDLYRHYHTFASTILDRVYLLSGRSGVLDIRLHNVELVRAAVERGQGCILMGAHVGSFEAVRALGGKLAMAPATMVMYEDNARKLNAVLNAINPELSQRIIALGKPDAMLKVRDALARGEFVGILADRVIAGEGSVECTFLGMPAKFPTGPVRMACMMKVPVLTMAGLYLGGNRYEVYFDTLQDAGTDALSASPEGIGRAVRSYAAHIERYCRIAPYNWFNFFDFWA